MSEFPKQDDNKKAVPFFARYLEGQIEDLSEEEMESVAGGTINTTLKYPSDAEDGGGVVMTKKYPSDAEDSCGGGAVMTKKYPSDSDEMATTQKYPSDGDDDGF